MTVPSLCLQQTKSMSMAFLFFDHLRELGHEPNTDIVGRMIRSCADARLLDRAYSLLNLQLQSGVAPNVHTFVPLIAGHLAMVRAASVVLHVARPRCSRCNTADARVCCSSGRQEGRESGVGRNGRDRA